MIISKLILNCKVIINNLINCYKKDQIPMEVKSRTIASIRIYLPNSKKDKDQILILKIVIIKLF